jgi:hypothetical protein
MRWAQWHWRHEQRILLYDWDRNTMLGKHALHGVKSVPVPVVRTSTFFLCVPLLVHRTTLLEGKYVTSLAKGSLQVGYFVCIAIHYHLLYARPAENMDVKNDDRKSWSMRFVQKPNGMVCTTPLAYCARQFSIPFVP